MIEPDGQLPQTPAELYGALFVEVQMRRLFADGKTFVDATARRPAAEIVAAFRSVPRDDAAIKAFIAEHFALPAVAAIPEPHAGGDVRAHIRALWDELARGPDAAIPGNSLIALDNPYVVPGGRFRELYYWDSYFSMLGLVRDDRRASAERMLDGFTDLIERFGYVPNGSRTYYVGRSQPPLYAAMVELLPSPDAAMRRRRLDAMIREHGFWMEGGADLAPGAATRRVVRLADGALLNRYWDARDTPRDESFREDVVTAAAAPERQPAAVYRDIRAAAESGWDFSSRWLGESGTLRDIRTICILPVDLNAFLYGAECGIARLAAALHEARLAARFRAVARLRRAAVRRHLWSAELGCFVDFDHALHRRSPQPTGAALAPLFAGIASPAQAAATARMVARDLLAPGGLRTTLIETGEQWDRPNGWAPLQWIAVAGLRRYGHHELGDDIAGRWCRLVAGEFARTGWLHEKYDVERCTAGGGGEYVPQHGFGWTNGVTATFLDSARSGNRLS